MSDILSVLQAECDRLEHEERIGDACPADYVGQVMLDIAFTPVVPGLIADPLNPILKPALVRERPDGRYQIEYPEDHDFEIVSADALKLMRARYLILRGWYYQHFRGLSYPEQQHVLAWYFPEGMIRIPALENTEQ